MKVSFCIDDLRKDGIQKKYIKTSKWAMMLSVGLLTIFTLFTILFAIYGIGLKSTFIVQDVTASNYGEKNTLLVWTVLIAADFIILFLWFIQKLVINGIYGKYINQRINESLIISNGIIKYGYQNSVGSTSSDRVIVVIPIDGIKSIKINREIERIELKGTISSKYYENYSKRITRAPKDNFTEGSFVLFDYFEPKLTEFFIKNNADIVDME